jgi:osmoprotectant transport system permease protein
MRGLRRVALIRALQHLRRARSDMPGNRVLLVLVLVGLAAAFGLAFLTHAPNRFVSGQPISLAEAAAGARLLALLPAIMLAAGPFLPQRRAVHGAVGAAAGALLLALLWLAGSQAAALAAGASPLARTSLGGAFWCVSLCSALALIDAVYRLRLSAAARFLAGVIVLGLIAALTASGALDQLGIAREYAVRRDVFAAAVLRHLLMVALALIPTVALGVPLGVVVRRRRAAEAAILPLLNIVQTIPSIALFGVLLVPLAALAAAFPGLAGIGIGGVGLAPAVIALILYALLPIVRNTAAGLASVSPVAIEAASGLGMTPRQVFWRIEAPLALPVFLSGLRIATIQTVGLAAVAALIGAGGLGALMFQGLFADALDLVLLGVVPIVLLAWAIDALFKLAIAYAARRP